MKSVSTCSFVYCNVTNYRTEITVNYQIYKREASLPLTLVLCHLPYYIATVLNFKTYLFKHFATLVSFATAII